MVQSNQTTHRPPKGMRRRTASLVRRLPWLVRLAYPFYSRMQARFTVGAVGLVFNERGEVLLVEHVFHPKAPWGLPGGWVNRHEDPEVAVVREIREELGMVVEPLKVVHIQSKYRGHLDTAFLCHMTTGVSALSFELLSHGWFAPENLPDLHAFDREAITNARRGMER
jgi:8-oxo-dGTP diphosphatase